MTALDHSDFFKDVQLSINDNPMEHRALQLIGRGSGAQLCDFSGFPKEGFDLLKFLKDILGDPAWTRFDGDGDIYFAWTRTDGTLITAYNLCSGKWVCNGASPDLDLIKDLRYMQDNILRTRRSSVSVVTEVNNMLQLTDLGMIEAPLERGNYTAEVLESYDHVAACMSSQTPCGRMVVMDGPPGTGKTHMIRGLVNQIPDAHYIVVGSSMVGELTGPAVMALLISNSSKHSHKCADEQQEVRPQVLILEDADSAVANRGNGMARSDRLGDILNLGDGLTGEMLDLRVIVTTNTKKVDLDPAITRPGRMCKHLHTPLLRMGHANRIHNRLTGKDFQKIYHSTAVEVSLADIYRRARQDGWEPKKREKFSGGGNYV